MLPPVKMEPPIAPAPAPMAVDFSCADIPAQALMRPTRTAQRAALKVFEKVNIGNRFLGVRRSVRAANDSKVGVGRGVVCALRHFVRYQTDTC